MHFKVNIDVNVIELLTSKSVSAFNTVGIVLFHRRHCLIWSSSTNNKNCFFLRLHCIANGTLTKRFCATQRERKLHLLMQILDVLIHTHTHTRTQANSTQSRVNGKIRGNKANAKININLFYLLSSSKHCQTSPLVHSLGLPVQTHNTYLRASK